jgi:hypothetical protein
MENPIIIEEGNYQEIAKAAKEIYKKIGAVQCLALNDSITFNNVGFKHLVRKGGIPRPKGEQKRRFALLRHAKAILKNPNVHISYRIKDKTHFWAFTETVENEKVTIIVRQISNRKKHFFSIF